MNSNMEGSSGSCISSEIEARGARRRESDCGMSVPRGNLEFGWTRVWLKPGLEDCVHYWVGTGAREGGRERFVCRWCGAEVADPVTAAPTMEKSAAEQRVRPGHVVCVSCGREAHHARAARDPQSGGWKCLRCLEDEL